MKVGNFQLILLGILSLIFIFINNIDFNRPNRVRFTFRQRQANLRLQFFPKVTRHAFNLSLGSKQPLLSLLLLLDPTDSITKGIPFVRN
jgi:hypothetical protein